MAILRSPFLRACAPLIYARNNLLFFIAITLLVISNISFANSFTPLKQESGATTVVLNPIESVHANTEKLVSFAVPFPKGFLTDVQTVKLLDESGREIAIYTASLASWKEINSIANFGVRSVLVQTTLGFVDVDENGLADPRVLTIEWGGSQRTANIEERQDVRSTWVEVKNGIYGDGIYEPEVFAVFEPQWYGKAALKTRINANGTHPDFSSYEVFYKNFSNTVLHKVDPRVSAEYLADYTDKYSAWLFDKPMALYQLALKTGDYSIFRAAHRAAQFFSKHIDDHGYFDLKSTSDMKYSHAEGLATNYLLTGDSDVRDSVLRMERAFDEFDVRYTLDKNFWTERHAAAKLVGLVVVFELTGSTSVAQKIEQTFSALLAMQNTPVDGVPNTGALMHTTASHAEAGEGFMMSPWMSALLIDAVERYYIHSSDERVKGFVQKLADYVAEHGVYQTDAFYQSSMPDSVVPYYIAGEGLSDAQHYVEPWSNSEHNLDVAKIFALAHFFSADDSEKQLGYLSTFSALYKTAMDFSLPYWIRPTAPAATVGANGGGMPAYRMSPERKFNWWFRTTSNLDWLIGNDTRFYHSSVPLASNMPFIEVRTSATATQLSKDESTIVTIEIENNGDAVAKGVTVWAKVHTNDAYYEVVEGSISNGGAHTNNVIFWSVGDLSNTETKSVSFAVRAKVPELSFTNGRKGHDIIVQSFVKYGTAQDTQENFNPATNIWSNGVYPLSNPYSVVSISTAKANQPSTITAIDQQLSVSEDESVDLILAATTDAQGEVKFSIKSQPQSGLLIGDNNQFQYQPNANFVGLDSFEFVATNGEGTSEIGFVTINVLPINDQPIALEQRVTMETNTTIQLSLEATDIDGHIAQYVVTEPEFGTISGEGQNIMYASQANYVGEVSVSYYVIDNEGSTSESVDVTIDVIPFDNAPEVEDILLEVHEDSAILITPIGTDSDNETLTFNVHTQPQKGVIEIEGGQWKYTPNLNYSGVDTFTYVASDGFKLSSPGTVIISVLAVNDAPEISELRVSTYVNKETSISINVSDIENDELTFTLVNQPLHGSISGSFPELIYLPDNQYIGQDSITVSVSDGENTVLSTIEIEVKDGSELGAYIQTAMDEGLLASWIGDYILNRISLYQTQVANVANLMAADVLNVSAVIEAKHNANMYLISSYSYLKQASNQQVYEQIDSLMQAMLFSTLSTQSSPFKNTVDYIYQVIRSEGINDWSINRILLSISQADLALSLDEDSSIVERVGEVIELVNSYQQTNPEKVIYSNIITKLTAITSALEAEAKLPLSSYISQSIDNGELASWIGSYIVQRIDLYEQQLLVIDAAHQNDDYEKIAMKHRANMLLWAAHSYLKYAGNSEVVDYISAEIDNMLLDTIEVGRDAVGLQQQWYQLMKDTSAHAWPIGELIKYLAEVDFYLGQHETKGNEEALNQAQLRYNAAMSFIDGYIDNNEAAVDYREAKAGFESYFVN